MLPLPPALRAAEPELGPGSGGGHRWARVGRTAAGGVSRGSQRGGEAACGLRATLGWRKGAAYCCGGKWKGHLTLQSHASAHAHTLAWHAHIALQQ